MYLGSDSSQVLGTSASASVYTSKSNVPGARQQFYEAGSHTQLGNTRRVHGSSRSGKNVTVAVI